MSSKSERLGGYHDQARQVHQETPRDFWTARSTAWSTRRPQVASSPSWPTALPTPSSSFAPLSTRSTVRSSAPSSIKVRLDTSYATCTLSRVLGREEVLIDAPGHVERTRGHGHPLHPRSLCQPPRSTAWLAQAVRCAARFYLLGGATSYLSKKQTTISMPSTEPKINGILSIYLRCLLVVMGHIPALDQPQHIEHRQDRRARP